MILPDFAKYQLKRLLHYAFGKNVCAVETAKPGRYQCRALKHVRGAEPLEFVDKAHVDVPGVLGGDAAYTRAACGGVPAPDIL